MAPPSGSVVPMFLSELWLLMPNIQQNLSKWWMDCSIALTQATSTMPSSCVVHWRHPVLIGTIWRSVSLLSSQCKSLDASLRCLAILASSCPSPAWNVYSTAYAISSIFLLCWQTGWTRTAWKITLLQSEAEVASETVQRQMPLLQHSVRFLCSICCHHQKWPTVPTIWQSSCLSCKMWRGTRLHTNWTQQLQLLLRCLTLHCH